MAMTFLLANINSSCNRSRRCSSLNTLSLR
jgi:hypothetical protein